jgi:tetratricopeptide (TPR) repeat protein
MAKVCQQCKKPYADKLSACPHCAEDALEGASPKTPPSRNLEDSGAIDLSPKGRIKTRRLPDPASELPGHRIAPEHPEGSEVDLGAEPRALGPQVIVPGGSMAGMGSEVNLGSLSEHRREDLPRVVMPGASGSHPSAEKLASMLSQAGSDPQAKEADPKVTQMAKAAAAKTMLAEGMDAEVAQGPQDPKATKIAKQSAAATMLAEGMEQDVAGGPKATQLAKQTSPKTQLADLQGALPIPKNTQLAGGSAKPTQIGGAGAPKATSLAGGSKPTQLASQDELEAAMAENDKKTKLGAGVAAKTKLASGGTPMTKLAKPTEQDLLRLPEKHQETKLAAGGTPMTKLARSDEQDELRLPDPDAPASVAEAGLEETNFDAPALDDETAVEDEVEPRVVMAPAPKPKYLSRWIMGGMLGMAAGAAAAVALFAFEVIPVDSVREMIGLPKTAKIVPNSREGKELGDALAHLEDGNFDKALAILGALPKTPQVLAASGQAKWLKHLSDKKAKNEKPKADEAPVQEAQADLTEAKNGDGAFWLGHIQEEIGGPGKGLELYKQGLESYKGDPKYKVLFESAVDRIESRRKPGDASTKNDAEGDNRFGAVSPLTLLFLGALQAPEDPPVAVPVADSKSAPEAGGDFWKAFKLAKAEKYDDAIKALKAARAAHDKRRYARLGKGQNPASDPTEEIFLRSCDELITLMQVYKAAQENGYKDPLGALKAAGSKDIAKNYANILELLKKDPDGLKDEAEGDPVKSLEMTLKVKGTNAEAIAEIKKALGDTKDFVADATKSIKESKERADALAAISKAVGKDYVNDDQPDPVKGVEKLVKDNGELKINFDELTKKYAIADGIVKGIVNRLVEKKYLAASTGVPDEILKGFEKLIKEAEAPVVNALARIYGSMGAAGRGPGGELARNFDLGAMLASSQTSNARYAMLLQQSRPPQQMLDLWLPLLADRDNKIIARLAALDAKRVKADKGAGAEAHAEAACVEGLALRNQGKYDDARTALAEAAKKAGEAAWRKYGTDGLAELTDPAAFYLPQADLLRRDNNFADAAKLLDRAAEAFAYDGKKAGRVLAMRAIVQADAARQAAKGLKVEKTNPMLAAASKDARAALASGAKSDGYYALGRVAEVTGDFANAHKNYRQAVAALPAGDRNSSNLRVSLARVLVRIPDVPPAEEEPEEKKPELKPVPKPDKEEMKEEEKKPPKKPAPKLDDKEEMKEDDKKPEKKPAPKPDDEEKKPEKKPADDKGKDDKKKPDDEDEKKPEKKPADDKGKDDKKADDKKADDKKADDKKADDKKADDKKKADDEEEKKPEKKKDDEKGKDDKGKDKDKDDKAKDDKDSCAPIEFFPLTASLAIAAPLPGDDEEDRPTPELDEAIKLAEQAIRDGNPEGHLIKGLALARKGRWTEAVLEYSKGLEKLDKDPEHAKGLRFLMENHPALRIPDGSMPADPINAEKHYALGLRLYWSRQYAAAEKEFFNAVRYHDQDARYMYFLGLSRLAQGKRAFAEASFRRGGMLEQANKPASATVSSVLERVQGPDRQLLNRYRP